jgi:opacity protein-like surface antigen
VPPTSDRFRVPLRVGPYFHRVELKEDSSSTKVDWDGYGVRLEASPEVWLLRRDAFAFGLSGDVSIGAHVTDIDLKSSGFSDSFSGNGYTFGAGIGVAALFGNHVTAELGYVYRLTNEKESDASNGIIVREATQSFRGVVLQLGVRF